MVTWCLKSMVLLHKGARERYVVHLKDDCGDPRTVATTSTVSAGVVMNDTRRLLLGTVTSDSTDSDADWAAAKIVIDFGTTATDAVEKITDAAMIMIAVDDGSGQVIYETPRSSVSIVPNPLG